MALMTLLPILGGRWFDGKRGTSHWALVGLVVGLLVGSWQLLQIVREANKKQRRTGATIATDSKRASAERESHSNGSANGSDASSSG